MPRKYNENQIKEALELLEKWAGCIGKVSSVIGTPPPTLKAWAALAIIDGTGPLFHDESYKEHIEYTSYVIKRMSTIGGPRCCKRNAFLSFSSAVEFPNKHYGVQMECSPITCEFTPYNPTCLKEACPFFSKKGIS